MNINTGEIRPWNEVENLSPEQRKNWTEIKRDLSALEMANSQIQKYSPCGCGSGNKFKFCCHQKERPASKGL